MCCYQMCVLDVCADLVLVDPFKLELRFPAQGAKPLECQPGAPLSAAAAADAVALDVADADANTGAVDVADADDVAAAAVDVADADANTGADAVADDAVAECRC